MAENSYVLAWQHLGPKKKAAKEPTGLNKTLKRVRIRLLPHIGAGFLIKVEDGEWSHKRSLNKTIKRLRKRLPNTKVGNLVRVKSERTGKVLRIYTVQAAPVLADLPSGSDSWPKAIKDIYQFVYAPGRYPGIQFWGVANCRQNRSSSCWSYHAWNQAIDVAPVSKAQGDQIEKDVAKEFGNDLMYIVWWSASHYDHLHIQVGPSRGCYEKPPCAK